MNYHKEKTYHKGESNKSSRLTVHKVIRMRELAAEGIPNKVLAIDFGVAEATVSQVIHRKTWRYV